MLASWSGIKSDCYSPNISSPSSTFSTQTGENHCDHRPEVASIPSNGDPSNAPWGYSLKALMNACWRALFMLRRSPPVLLCLSSLSL
uniref:Uncharacterized protein n=1 Tax=Anguilla anguilla TaxID=7936 RepID=A0A0E9P5Y9_ANGAN